MGTINRRFRMENAAGGTLDKAPAVMRACAALWVLLLGLGSESAAAPIAIGSKVFSESHVLAELSAQILEAEGFIVERRLGLVGTLIA